MLAGSGSRSYVLGGIDSIIVTFKPSTDTGSKFLNSKTNENLTICMSLYQMYYNFGKACHYKRRGCSYSVGCSYTNTSERSNRHTEKCPVFCWHTGCVNKPVNFNGTRPFDQILQWLFSTYDNRLTSLLLTVTKNAINKIKSKKFDYMKITSKLTQKKQRHVTEKPQYFHQCYIAFRFYPSRPHALFTYLLQRGWEGDH